MELSEVIKRSRDKESDIVNAYLYGSRVYQTFNKTSDYDFIFIVLEGSKSREQFSDNLININYFTISEHLERISSHEISALEVLFLPSKYVLKENLKFTFTLNKEFLRRSLSAKSSNSFVKAKKKLTIQKDYNYEVGVKSLFHSFRIIYYGIQIARHGSIADYTEANSLLFEMKQIYQWEDMFDKYKKNYNALLTEFRKLCPL